MVKKNPDKYEVGKTFVYFVRHGDRIKIPGSPEPHDFSLSSEGIKQAKGIAKDLAKIKKEIDILYTSPMKRAYETAVEIGKKIGKKPIIIKGFEEVSKIINKPNPFNWKYWKARIRFRHNRRVFDKILEKNNGKVIVFVGHGRLNRMLIGKKLGLSHKKSNMFDSHNCRTTLARFNRKKLDFIYYFNSPKIN